MIGEILIWGFFSALGWMAANWTVDKIIPEKPRTEQCSEWVEKENLNGVKTITRVCDKLGEK
jgi:hypothetical protein